MRIFRKFHFLFLLTLLVLALGGCAIDGTSYLALDFSGYEPVYVSFPAFSSFFYWGDFYEHAEGTWNGYYEVSNGITMTYHSFTYTIEANPGKGFIFGAPGDDRYYTMWLDHLGPTLYYYDVAASLAGKGAGNRTPVMNGGTVDLSKYDLDHPIPYSFEKQSGPYTFRIEGNRYLLKK